MSSKTSNSTINPHPLVSEEDYEDAYDSTLEDWPERFRHTIAKTKTIQDRSNCTHGGPPPRGKKTLEKISPRVISCVELLDKFQKQVFRNHANDPDDLEYEQFATERRDAVLQALTQHWRPYANE